MRRGLNSSWGSGVQGISASHYFLRVNEWFLVNEFPEHQRGKSGLSARIWGRRGACAGQNSRRSTRHRGLRGRGPAANTLGGKAEIPLVSVYGVSPRKLVLNLSA